MGRRFGLLIALIALIALVVALGVGWLALARLRDDESASAAAPRPVARNELPAPGIAEPERIAESAPASERDSAADAHPQPASEPPAPVAPAPDVEVGGRLIVIGVDGAERTPNSGSFAVVGWHGSSGSNATAQVADGRWTVKLPAKEFDSITHLSFSEFIVDGARATLEEPLERVAVPQDRKLDLRVRLPKHSVLRVIDMELGGELSDVTVVRSADFPDSEGEHPGLSFDERVVARGLASPIDLDALSAPRAGRGSGSFLIGSPGYAWAAVQIDQSHGGERVVALVRGGDLVVHLIGLDARSGAQLRARHKEKEGAPLLSIGLGSRENLEITGLASGPIVLRAEIGEWFRNPRVLGETEVEIVTGTTQTATLSLESPPAQGLARAGGRIYVPAEWKPSRLMVVVNLLDPPVASFDAHQSINGRPIESDRAGFDCYAWEDKVQVGRYELGIYQPHASIVIDVPPGGRDDFVLEIGAPVEVAVRVVDADTGDDVVVQALLWNPVRPEGVSGGTLDNAKFNKESNRYEFRAPQGRIQIAVHDLSLTPAADEFDVARPRAETTLRVKPACGFVLRLKDGDTLVPLPEDWWQSPKDSAGADVRGTVAFDPLGRRFQVPEPGRYTLEMPKLSGYRQLPAQTVDVVARTFVELVVQLEREHP